jgi:hypothetical protein
MEVSGQLHDLRASHPEKKAGTKWAPQPVKTVYKRDSLFTLHIFSKNLGATSKF